MADPDGYEPESAWWEALLEVCGDEADARAVAVLADMARWSHLERGRQLHNQMAFALQRFWRRWGGVPAAAGPDLPDAPPEAEGDGLPPASTREERLALIGDLLSGFARLHAAADRIRHNLANPWLKAELRPWAEKLAGWCETATLALTALRTAVQDPSDPSLPELRQAAVDRLWATREDFHWVAGDLFDQFARRCLWAADREG
jgi:hyaluronoglucosaminidase